MIFVKQRTPLAYSLRDAAVTAAEPRRKASVNREAAEQVFAGLNGGAAGSQQCTAAGKAANGPGNAPARRGKYRGQAIRLPYEQPPQGPAAEPIAERAIVRLIGQSVGKPRRFVSRQYGANGGPGTVSLPMVPGFAKPLFGREAGRQERPRAAGALAVAGGAHNPAKVLRQRRIGKHPMAEKFPLFIGEIGEERWSSDRGARRHPRFENDFRTFRFEQHWMHHRLIPYLGPTHRTNK